MIPKVIHYCWFGGKRKSKLIKQCILSWKHYLRDYEIIEWNEKNCDLTNPFVRNAYTLKKWAFVADYIRLKVLYENGGVYLDADMMVIKSFDSLLSNLCFFGAEDEEYLNCAVIGAEKNNAFIKQCISRYEVISINNEIDWHQITIPKIVTDIYRRKYNYVLPFNRKTEHNGLVIYPTNYFYPLPHKDKHDVRNFKNYLSKESFAVHLWNESWIEYNEFQYLRKGKYALGLKIALKNIFINGKIDKAYFRKILSCFKESLIKK